MEDPMEGTEMSDFDTNPMISKIRKLLKLAESAAALGTPEGDAEAGSANDKATELMAKYGVDQALLANRGEIKDNVTSKKIQIFGNYAMDRRVLLGHIISALGGKGVIFTNHRPGTYRGVTYTMHVFAFESDMNRIEFLFSLLSTQMLVGAAAARPQYWENKRSFRKSWMTGFAMAIYNRLDRSEKQAVSNAEPGTALVLFNRSAAVTRAQDEEYGKLGSATTRKLAGSGRNQGYAAGQRASLGDNQLGGSRQALVSAG